MVIKVLVPGKSIGKKRPHVNNKFTNNTPNNREVYKKKRKKSCKNISVRRCYFNNDQ